MSYGTIEVRKLSPIIGAEVHGVDLSKPLDDRQIAEIHDAWMDNLVIFFRDQSLTVEQHLEFGRRFGDLHLHPAALQPQQHPEILVIKADETSKRVAGEEWHSDVSCDAEGFVRENAPPVRIGSLAGAACPDLANPQVRSATSTPRPR